MSTLFAFDELLCFLQTDLRIELIVFLDHLDFSPGDGPIDAVEIKRHAVEIVLARVGDAAGEGIENADADRFVGLRQKGRRGKNWS